MMEAGETTIDYQASSSHLESLLRRVPKPVKSSS